MSVVRRAYQRSDRWMRRQTFPVRMLITFTGILVLDLVSAVFAKPYPNHWLPTLTILAATLVLGTVILIVRTFKRRGRIPLEK